jgi:hypothetical protein
MADVNNPETDLYKAFSSELELALSARHRIITSLLNDLDVMDDPQATEVARESATNRAKEMRQALRLSLKIYPTLTKTPEPADV